MPSPKDRWVDWYANTLIAKRRWLILFFAALTLALAGAASRTRLDAGFFKMIPLKHEHMQAFSEYLTVFPGANRILVNLRWQGDGDIYNKAFLDTLRKATDDVAFIPGVDRTRVSSLFTPDVRFIEVTERGFYGDVIVPPRFSGEPDELATVRRNVAKSGVIGLLVQSNLKGAMVRADLQEIHPQTGDKVDDVDVAHRLDEIRKAYASENIDVNIIGFPVLMGELVKGLTGVCLFFGIAFVITAALLYAHTRSLKLTMVALVVALLPTVWLLGILALAGYGIDPFSILVLFLTFSIGVSHAVQMTNAWAQEVIAGADAPSAAHSAVRKLFVPGAVALLTNALGFAVIMRIEIESVRELGMTACIGVLLMIPTNKVLLPALLSHIRLERGAMTKARGAAAKRGGLWWTLSGSAARRPAAFVLLVCCVLLAVGTAGARYLTIGDIGDGAPELRASSQYNRDYASIVGNYVVGVDVLAVVVEAKGYEDDACLHYPVMHAVDRFEIFMRGVHGVQSVVGVPDMAKVGIAANNEGNPRWQALPRSRRALQQGAGAYNPDLGMNTDGCTAMQVLIYTKDHQGATLAHIVEEVKRFKRENAIPGESPRIDLSFRLAGGNAGIMAATNEEVARAEVTMLLSIFGAIALICLITFRTWRAVLCIVVPLAIASILCNALMAALGIGLKVATLPVIALGVGVGVDYGIYLYERIEHEMAGGAMDFRTAFYEAIRQRGTPAVFTALTMAIGVGAWAFSPLKFQADMGILLAFMFLVNVLGAIFLLPALAAWLLPRCQRRCSGAQTQADLRRVTP
ncbi:RND family transporter [Pandoraea sp. NPDC087047]|uniref:efflux RND transporter permease subunit n=1 Tax=Pandoraea sp. NPDC087047 TaxID=3364390 RepID=UPI0038228B77